MWQRAVVFAFEELKWYRFLIWEQTMCLSYFPGKRPPVHTHPPVYFRFENDERLPFPENCKCMQRSYYLSKKRKKKHHLAGSINWSQILLISTSWILTHHSLTTGSNIATKKETNVPFTCLSALWFPACCSRSALLTQKSFYHVCKEQSKSGKHKMWWE